MRNSGLKYWWEIVEKHNGSSRFLQYHSVYVMWKPLVWFVMGLKRQYIGIEKEHDHFIMAKGRIDLELSGVGSS